jgi:hypothetical protein
MTMSKIYGLTRIADEQWRMKTNQKINSILKGQNIIGFIKKQRLKTLGHVERMAEDNNERKINIWKPTSNRPFGRPKSHCEDDISGHIRSLNVNIWKNVVQDRVKWKETVERAITLYRV